MKKTYHINLNNQVFCIDEDACAQLQDYIDTLEKYYTKEEDGKEIMADIESRIAELFSESLQKYHKEVISQPDIDRVIGIMGTPDILIDEDSTYVPKQTYLKRKLYRDGDKALLGGVAAGLSNYFSISIIWFRLAFVLLGLFYGITILTYIILWIVIPLARTARQKLEMKGERINVSNIEKKIRNLDNEVRNNSDLKKNLNAAGDRLTAFFSCLGRIFMRILFILGSILATFGLLMSLFFFLMTCWGIFYSIHILPENYQLFGQYMSAPIPLWAIKLVLFCLINIPLFLIIYFCITFLFKFQRKRNVLLIAGMIWIISCFTSIFFGIYYMTNHAYISENKTEVSLTPADPAQKILNIQFNGPRQLRTDNPFYLALDKYLIYPPHGQDTTLLYLQPMLRFVASRQSAPQLVLLQEARGFSSNEALRNSENINYSYKWANDTLQLNTYFTLNKPQMRANQLRLVILIPENYQVNLDNTPWYKINDYNLFGNLKKLKRTNPAHQEFIMENDKLKTCSE